MGDWIVVLVVVLVEGAELVLGFRGKLNFFFSFLIEDTSYLTKNTELKDLVDVACDLLCYLQFSPCACLLATSPKTKLISLVKSCPVTQTSILHIFSSS